uniref:Replication protein A 32 kDa subunit-A-like n=1 Tax=Hirondellea gigas TaxID=1518452 RepID=A0A2P2HYU7_9CRUS
MWNNTGSGFGGGDFDGGYSNNEGAGSAGGGFMNSPGQFNTPNAAKRERRIQNIMSTSIRDILECNDESYTIEGMEVNMVVLVGIVRSVEISATKISYGIDDHTGIIDVLRYPDGDVDENVTPDALAEGVYARVYGPVRRHQDKRHVIGFKVEQIENPNLVTSHILEVIHQRLKVKQLENTQGGGGGGAGAVLQNSTLQNIPNVAAGSSLGPEKDMLFAAIRSTTSEAGISKAELKSLLAGKLNADKIERLVDELSSEGIIYTTHDDDHFLAIES